MTAQIEDQRRIGRQGLGLSRTEIVMGMPIDVDLRDRHVTSDLLDDVFAWFRQVDGTFSTYSPGSEISRLNSGALRAEQLSQEAGEVLDRCERLRSETEGYFDVRGRSLPVALTTRQGTNVAIGIDPSGFVKGWAVDRAADMLARRHVGNFCINAGGDVRLKGGALPQPEWRIGIRHPLLADAIAAVVAATDTAIATSAEYARGRHVIDPHTGEPPDGVLSVTIVGRELASADGYATAAFAMGANGPRWTLGLRGYEAMTILSDETVLMTPGYPKTEAADG